MTLLARTLAAFGIGSIPLDLGTRGERLAARKLRRKGYVILERNVRLKIGEADIVCLAPDRETIVIVEVKTRLRGQTVSAKANVMAPEASVHQHKRQKLISIARSLINANRWQQRPVRIDVVAIEWPDRGGSPVVRHHEGVIAVAQGNRGPTAVSHRLS